MENSVPSVPSMAPWQQQWKRPIWNNLDDGSPHSGRAKDSNVVAHAAAAITQEEGEGDFLTVTLKQTNSAPDTLVLELVKDDVVVQSKILRWPTAIDSSENEISTRGSLSTVEIGCFPGGPRLPTVFGTTHAPLLQDIDGETAEAYSGTCFPKNPLLSSSRERNREQCKKRKPDLVAIALVRLPPLPPKGDTSKDMSEVRTGIVSNERKETSTTDLCLVCLSTKGMVHVYSALNLLRKCKSTLDNELDQSMASFMFGTSLFATVQDTIAPLSQPEQTVKLSVPFLQSAHEEDAERSPNRTTNKSFLSIFDSSAWDPILDSGSLKHQTKGNVPTLCIAAFKYICVGGCGRQRWTDDLEISEPDEDTMWNSGGSGRYNGGFVTFISLHTYTETKTVFLPFVPCRMSCFRWGTMMFLQVIGDGNAIAICMSSAENSCIPNGTSTESVRDNNCIEVSGTGDQAENTRSSHISFSEFQVFPVDLPVFQNESMLHLFGSESATSPPGLIALSRKKALGSVELSYYSFKAIAIVPSGTRASLREKYERGNGQLFVIQTKRQAGHTARIPAPLVEPFNMWCCVGQGLCIVGLPNAAVSVCLEGANLERGAYVHSLHSDEQLALHRCAFSSVIPLNSVDATVPAESRNTHTSAAASVLPLNLVENDGSKVKGMADERDQELDGIIIEAIKSISSTGFSKTAPSQLSHMRKRNSCSFEEKAGRLLQRCSSWATIERSTDSQFERQSPFLSIRGKGKETNVTISLRETALDAGPAAQFKQVLGWLSKEKNYFSAASLALDLLRDSSSLRHLWRAYDKIDDEGERSRLDGLLDGIAPIYSDELETQDDCRELEVTLTQLADMTVGCLTKGGHRMLSTLQQFLQRNTNYDPSRASLILAASLAQAMSVDQEEESHSRGVDTVEADDSNLIYWPVRCLLQIGVSRNHNLTVLSLLNATIPNEIRSRDSHGVSSTTDTSINRCKTLISLIVGASKDSLDALFDLIDEKSNLRFWDSIGDDIKLELSLVNISNAYPMLCDPEVRAWTLSLLHDTITSEERIVINSKGNSMKTETLRIFVLACMKNAGCDVGELLCAGSGETTPISFDDGSLESYGHNLVATRHVMLPRDGNGGLDFGLLIPALLLLDHRQASWHVDASTPTRCVLNAACYLAGRRNFEEPTFVIDGTILMQQCSLVGNVEAGANLIGGKNGYILELCYLLIEELGFSMDEAEEFLLTRSVEHNEYFNQAEASKEFELRKCHCRILWLLKEHVLAVRTYGEFETHQVRGKVHPVFAASLCFRSWWIICQHELEEASAWLTSWLREQLSISVATNLSSNRLACAALIRALVWPEDNKDESAPVLADILNIDGLFLFQLSKSCCGLIEALPDYIASTDCSTFVTSLEISRKASISPFQLSSLEASNTLDESFVSALGSFQDLE